MALTVVVGAHVEDLVRRGLVGRRRLGALLRRMRCARGLVGAWPAALGDQRAAGAMSWSNAIGVHLAHLRSDLREFIGLLNFLKAEYPVGDIYFFIPAANENAGRTLQVLERLAG